MPNQLHLDAPPPDTGKPYGSSRPLPGLDHTVPGHPMHTATPLTDERSGYLHLFTDGLLEHSTGEAAAACVVPELGASQSCRLPFPTTSTRVELAGLHLAASSLGPPP